MMPMGPYKVNSIASPKLTSLKSATKLENYVYNLSEGEQPKM